VVRRAVGASAGQVDRKRHQRAADPFRVVEQQVVGQGHEQVHRFSSWARARG
jgi:hypothetical protein